MKIKAFPAANNGKRVRFFAYLAVFSILFVVPTGVSAQARAAWDRIDAARDLLEGATPRAEAIRLDLPAVSQDGSSIALTVEVNSPMTADNHVEVLYLFASGNPTPEIAEFEFTPLAGQAHVSTRIRLDGSQTVVALARTSRGEWLAGSRDVRVTVSGCLSQNSSFASEDFMTARVRPPNRFRAGEPADIRTLINHPMETGLRKGDDGQMIPERIINEFSAKVEGEKVIKARFHRAIAANPYLLFYVDAGRSGDLSLEWKEDTGEIASATAVISR